MFARGKAKALSIVRDGRKDGAIDGRPMTDVEKAFTGIIERYTVYNSENNDLTDKNGLICLSESGMKVWNQINRLLSGEIPFETGLKETMEELACFFNARSGYVFLLGSKNFKVVWSTDDDYYFPTWFEDPTQTALDEWSELLKGDSHIFINDTADENLPAKIHDAWEKRGVKNSHNTAIFIDDKIVGSLCLNNVEEKSSDIFVIDMVTKSIAHAFHRYELEAYSRRLRFQDDLTGYLNLEGFRQIAEERLVSHPEDKYALWYCDIKRFKYINDIFGYSVGDDFLRYWLDSIDRHIGENDTFGRISGDNVTIFSAYESIVDIENIFRAISETLLRFPGLQDKNFKPEMISGVYLLEDQDVAEGDINTMLNRANIAQKSVKNLSGNRFALYDEDIRKKQLRELEISQHLETGLKNGEFYINLQPQYNYATGDLVGAESLVRWKHPSLGLVSPGEFIPLLEQAGLITDLDFFVWEETCKFLRFLLDNSDTFSFVPISVNISRVDIYVPNLSRRILELVNKYDLKPEMLRLEITESAYMSDSSRLIEVVNDFQHEGFLVEMDDFGSGYSSLNSLKEVMVDALKLDMAFLEGGYDSDRGGQILSAVVSMAHGINLPTIAEGVETEEQADFLKSIGCNVMQGYYFAKPISKTAFMGILRTAKTGSLPFSAK